MTATSEQLKVDLPAKLKIPLLMLLLGFAVVYGVVSSGFLRIESFWGPRGGQATFAFAINLFIVGVIWGLSKLKPSIPTTVALFVLLAFAGVLGFGATVELVSHLRANNFLGLWNWTTLGLLGANLLVFAGALWGLSRLRPWQVFKRSKEPVSPATRRTKLLFGLSGVVSVLAVVALMLGTAGTGEKFDVWTNSQNVAPRFAVIAIAILVLSMALSWWWYYSADEHERRANDVGFLLGGAVFLHVTPIWWIAARAGLLPPPDAMIIWFASSLVMGIGWWWYRSR